MKLDILAFALFCTAIGAAARPLAAQGHDSSATGVIRGRITGEELGPSAGASVTLEGTRFHTATDSAGRFMLSGIPAATYTAVASAAGFAVRRRSVTVIAGRAVELDIDLITTATRLPAIVVSSRPLHVIGHLPDVRDGVIYDGKKTDVIVMDSLRANTAQDIERQILGRVPGANFSETEAAGFPSNGVGFRGLNPTQSVEMNTRQNGINIAADLYGYPETYYTPPAEALDRIELVSGAGALAFGPQFGGVINYVVKQGTPNTPPTLTTTETGGSFGLINSFTGVRGGTDRWTYSGFANYRGEDGWRPNSDFRQVTGYGSATYQASDRLSLGLEYTFFRNRIHMPGGLSDAEFAQDPQRSFRARNWLASPWNIAAVRAQYVISPHARLGTVLSNLASDRHLVWRNEDGGPQAADSIDPTTGTFVPREVERETFNDWTLESRLDVDQIAFGRPNTLAAGLRAGINRMRRYEGGPGSTGSDFDMHLYGGTWERALRFGTTNLAAFAEDLIQLTERLSLTPGIRYEYLRSTASGYTDIASTFAPLTVSYPLVGIIGRYVTTSSTELYANITEAYRPVLYASLTPFGSIARVDPGLHASRGYDATVGWRGTMGDGFKIDADVFYLWYGDRVGTRTVTDSTGASFAETANIGNSVHTGAETYVEVDPLVLLGAPRALGSLDLFTSLAYIDARYVSGEFRENRVEQAPRVLARAGLTYGVGPVSSTFQMSYTGLSYGDANNSITPTDDAAAGLVPAYTVLDWSGAIRIGHAYDITVGVNNLANARYFTKRTDEYPGPGILPGIGRSAYAGIRATLTP